MIATIGYMTVGIAIPIIVSKYSSADGMKFRKGAGKPWWFRARQLKRF